LTNIIPLKPLAETITGFEHIRRYWDKDRVKYAAKILPGEYYVTLENELIVTTLGSCIAACIRDPAAGVGGMNHFMLPYRISGISKKYDPRISFANRYGNYAMENLINDILKNGGRKQNLEIKVFGGGKVLTNMTDVGQKNIEFIENYVQTEGLKLLAKDLGDVFPRKVVYDPITGNVRVKKLRTLHNNTIAQREDRYLKDIDDKTLSGKIELFKQD